MRHFLFPALALATALAACGRPAADQPPAQTPETTAAAVVAPAPAAAVDFPAVPSAEEIAASAAAAGMPVTPEERMKLVCDNGERMVVRFFPEQGIAVLVRASGNSELNRETADQGLRYTGGDVALTGYGQSYTVALGAGQTTSCTAA